MKFLDMYSCINTYIHKIHTFCGFFADAFQSSFQLFHSFRQTSQLIDLFKKVRVNTYIQYIHTHWKSWSLIESLYIHAYIHTYTKSLHTYIQNILEVLVTSREYIHTYIQYIYTVHTYIQYTPSKSYFHILPSYIQYTLSLGYLKRVHTYSTYIHTYIQYTPSKSYLHILPSSLRSDEGGSGGGSGSGGRALQGYALVCAASGCMAQRSHGLGSRNTAAVL